MSKNRLWFECAECGCDKLRLTGFEVVSATVGFSIPFANSDAGPEHWDVQYAEPKDGPQALVVCDKCGHEVKVKCRIEETGRTMVLWPAELYQMLYGALELHGVQDEAFKGVAEIDWKSLLARLKAKCPRTS